MDDQKYLELEERIRMLEEKLERISFSEAKEITMQNCPIGDVRVGDDCRLSFEHCPIGSVMMDDLEDADSRIDDLEGRLDDIDFDDAEHRLDELQSRLDGINSGIDEAVAKLE